MRSTKPVGDHFTWLNAKRRPNGALATLVARAEELAAVLATGLTRHSRVDFTSLKQRLTPPAFDPGPLATQAPEPVWEQFASATPGVLKWRRAEPWQAVPAVVRL